jgi:aryl-alcohol dehydrogenase-like predicted oxidoreductase
MITPIGLGVWQFSGGNGLNRWVWQALEASNENAIVQAALDGGINWFDTAESYGNGRSERGLSSALQEAGVAAGEVVIATKWQPALRTAGSIGKTIQKRIANLAPYLIDLHQVHHPYSISRPDDVMAAMAALAGGGLIKAVGISNFSAAQMLRAHSALQKLGMPLASNQVKYSLLDRKIEGNGVLESARALGITIIAYTPLDWGLLTGKFHEHPDLVSGLPLARRLVVRRKLEASAPVVAALKQIATRYNATPSQVALNWLVNYSGETVVTIPGASKPRHARESAGAMSFSLSREELDGLDQLTRKYR